MENIVTRSAARQNGSTSYFTGEPCKNGHLVYRYTQSGTCSACIRASNGKVTDNDAVGRRSAKLQLIQARFRLFDVDREVFASAAWGLAASRYPQLLQSDIETKNAGVDCSAGTGLYLYNLHVDDHAVLLQLALDLTRSHSAKAEVNATLAEVRKKYG
jgi:hypothetical protein